MIEQLKRVCAAYDRERLDAMTARAQSGQEKCNLEHELALSKKDISDLKKDLASKEAALADKEAALADKDKEIEELKSRLEDSRHREESLKQDKFAGKSKRSIDRRSSTARGRDDDKDDYDGTPGSGAPCDESNPAQSYGADSDATISIERFNKTKAARPSKYRLADASVKVKHLCDISRIPEGAEIIGMSEETVFSEERVIRADVYQFVKYRVPEEYVDENGDKQTRWREHTVHIPVTEGKSGCRCDETRLPEPVRRGQLPNQVGGTHMSPGMLAGLMFDHYFCNVPMNRLSKAFGEWGFKVGRSTLENMDAAVAGLLRPLHSALLDEVLCDDAVVFCDETWKRIHLPDRTFKVYDWIIGNRKKKAAAYIYDDGSRGRKVLVGILENRNIKALHSDGYTAYYYLEESGIVHICCGAHVCRKLKEWYERTKDPDAKALLLDLGELFRLDAMLKERQAPPEEVLNERNSPKTLDIISRFNTRVGLLLEKCPEIPGIGLRALNYAREVGAKMFRWRENADYELDNNFAERLARPVATSRKTSLFHCSHKGAEHECIIRSFFETCRLCDVSPVAWFKAFFEAVLQGRTDYPNLLPGVLPVV